MPTVVRLGAIVIAVAAAACGGTSPVRMAAAPAAQPLERLSDTTELTRVRFARGTTSGIVNDSLRPGETRGYLLGAEQGQVMMVHAVTWPVRRGQAPSAAATVRVYSAADGNQVTAPWGEGTLWSGRVPAPGDFVVRVTATEATAYTLAVQIPRRLAPGAGDSTAAVAGTTPSRAPVDYIVQGESGQTLAASLRDGDPATLHLYGLDGGEQLAPLAEGRKLWAGKLPTAQDYVISVVPAHEGASYRLSVTLR